MSFLAAQYFFNTNLTPVQWHKIYIVFIHEKKIKVHNENSADLKPVLFKLYQYNIVHD